MTGYQKALRRFDAAVSEHDFKTAEMLLDEHKKLRWPLRPLKGFRCKDVEPERHARNKALHDSGRNRDGLTGKQLRKERKKSLKRRMRAKEAGR